MTEDINLWGENNMYFLINKKEIVIENGMHEIRKL